jgi:choline dehydrogenase-like flavoprotein
VGLESDEWDAEAWRYEGDGAFDLGPGTERRVAQVLRKSDRSFGDAYRRDLEETRRVRVLLHANVTEIDVPSDGRGVVSLRVATPEGRTFRVRPRFVVLATGGIENARLLLASRSTRPAGLGNERDLVGRYFVEHPRFEAAVVVPTDRYLRGSYYETHNVRGVEVQGYPALDEETQAREELLDVQLLVEPVFGPGFEGVRESEAVVALRSLGTVGGPLADHVRTISADLLSWHRATIPGAPIPLPYPEVLAGLAGDDGGADAMLAGVLGDIGTFAYRQVRGVAPIDHLSIRTRLEQAPNRESRVFLGDERDALGVPRVVLDWRLDRLDRRSAARTVELFGAAFAASGVGRLRAQFDEEGSTWPDDLTGGWHHMGTTRMSDDPAQGVVDRHGQVHGIPNLYVAGSSVFPTAGSSTPTLTIVALALRLADRLTELLR